MSYWKRLTAEKFSLFRDEPELCIYRIDPLASWLDPNAWGVIWFCYIDVDHNGTHPSPIALKINQEIREFNINKSILSALENIFDRYLKLAFCYGKSNWWIKNVIAESQTRNSSPSWSDKAMQLWAMMRWSRYLARHELHFSVEKKLSQLAGRNSLRLRRLMRKA